MADIMKMLESLDNIPGVRVAVRKNETEIFYHVYRGKTKIMTIFFERERIEIYDAFSKRIKREDNFRPFVQEFRRQGFNSNYFFDC